MTSTTETEKSLSRRVAERLGWRVLIGINVFHCYYADLFRPNGSWHGRYKETDYTNFEVAAWANAGNYEHDLNAAVRDCRMAGYRLVLRLQEGIRCFACYEKKIDIKHWEAIIETMQTSDENNPAEAVCLAFEALCVVVEGE